MTSERNRRHLANRAPYLPELDEADPSPGADGGQDGHAEIIRRGPVLWNAWRQNNPSIVPELTGLALEWCERRMGPCNGGPVELKFAQLGGADL